MSRGAGRDRASALADVHALHDVRRAAEEGRWLAVDLEQRHVVAVSVRLRHAEIVLLASETIIPTYAASTIFVL